MKMWAVRFGHCKGFIWDVEGFEDRRVTWVRPSGASNGRLSYFDQCFPRFFTSDSCKVVFLGHTGINKLLIVRGDDEKWEGCALGPAGHPHCCRSCGTSVILPRYIYVREVRFLSKDTFWFQFEAVLNFLLSKVSLHLYTHTHIHTLFLTCTTCFHFPVQGRTILFIYFPFTTMASDCKKRIPISLCSMFFSLPIQTVVNRDTF